MKQNGENHQYDLQDIYTDDSGIRYPKNLLRPLNANAVLIAGIVLVLLAAAFCGVALADAFPPNSAIPSADKAAEYITFPSGTPFIILDQNRDLPKEFYADIKNNAEFSFEGTITFSVSIENTVPYEINQKLSIGAEATVKNIGFLIPEDVREAFVSADIGDMTATVKIEIINAEGRFFR